jgi:hypothetical protein
MRYRQKKTHEKGLKQGGREAHQAMKIFVEHEIFLIAQQFWVQDSEKRAGQAGFQPLLNTKELLGALIYPESR